MFTSDPFTHLLDDPWAPHPVVNRHVCSGGGGSKEAPQVPDYSQYISHMSKIGEQGMDWARDLFNQAKGWGVDLQEVATDVSGKAGAAADTQQATSERLQGESDEMRDYWKGLSRPMYEAQQREAMRMNADLPAYMEHEAGRQGGDTAVAIDQQKAALQRKMLADGTAGGRPGIASQALDTMASIGRAAGVTAAAERGRYGAKQEARDALTGALKQEEFIPGVSSDLARQGATQAGLATANRGQQAAVPIAAMQGASSLYTPAAGFYSASIPASKEWGNATANAYNQTLAGYEAGADDSTMGDVLGLAGTIGGAAAGTMLAGPGGGMTGAMVGGTLGGSAGKSAGKLMSATGGKIMGRRVPRGYAGGGAIDTSAPSDNFITPDMSPSGGAEVDDVPAMVSEGEFVIPERTVDWFGEKYFQNLIMKSDKDRETQTVAAPEEGPPDQQQAMDTSAPMFRSEGART